MAYLTLWLGGCALGLVAGSLVFRSRGALSWRALAVLAAAFGGLMIGSRVQYEVEQVGWWAGVPSALQQFVYGGRRLPLGLVAGALTGGVTGVLTRVPWRTAGDALAVAASVVISVGRFGCLLNGCCAGSACPAWMAPLCIRYPPGTEAYTYQVAWRQIAPGSDWSLPVHPLPLYFAASAFLTLLLLVWMLRRGVAPGLLLAVFCIVRPATKLALEYFRMGTPDGPSGLMLAVPLAVLGTSTAVLLAAAAGRSASGTTVLAGAPGDRPWHGNPLATPRKER